MSRFLPVVLCGLALGGVLGGCSSGDPDSAAPSAAEVERAFAGSPAPLAKIHAQANELLDGGADAFERRLRELKGHPVVVNKWAAWCDPCREEFPYFQRQAVEHGKRVAFLGVDAVDNDGDAEQLLEKLPVTYPSYKDPSLKVTALFDGEANTPVTVFYDSDGELAYLKQGAYLDEQALAEDIERYAR